MIEPQEARYGDQKHTGSIAVGTRSEGRFSKDGLFDELKKALAERVLNAEMEDHLESEASAGKANHRNGYSKKTVLTQTSNIDVRVPRDREGSRLSARNERNGIACRRLPFDYRLHRLCDIGAHGAILPPPCNVRIRLEFRRAVSQ